MLLDRIGRQTQANAVVFPIARYTFDEPEIWGRVAARFSATWLMAVVSKVNGAYPVPGPGLLTAFYQRSGLWQPVGANDWTRWRTSLKTAFEPRGAAKLGWQPTDDALISLCDSQGLVTAAGTSELSAPAASSVYGDLPVALPTGQDAYVAAQSEVVVESDSNIVRHRPIPPAQLPTERLPDRRAGCN